MSHSIHRRDFVKLLSGAAAATLAPAALSAPRKWKNIPVGTQAWCVRKQMAEDIPGTLAAVAKLGYQGIELENYYGRSAKEWKQWLADARLKPCGTHIHIETMLGDRLAETVDFNKTIGNRNLVVRSMKKEVYTDRDLFLKTLDQYDEIAERIKPYGLRVSYHNHGDIFKKFDGEYLIDIYAAKTRKDVGIQFDTGNASDFGVDIMDFIKRHARRITSMHVKPYSKAKPNAYLGDDELNWPQIFSLVEKAGALDWYIIEYEKEGVPPLESLGANLQNFRRMRAQA
jgi:sugar phosphate isomerase/epimerase